jgi:hypothetical protein
VVFCHVITPCTSSKFGLAPSPFATDRPLITFLTALHVQYNITPQIYTHPLRHNYFLSGPSTQLSIGCPQRIPPETDISPVLRRTDQSTLDVCYLFIFLGASPQTPWVRFANYGLTGGRGRFFFLAPCPQTSMVAFLSFESRTAVIELH